MPEKEKVWTIVVAAGSGLRFGGAKQFERLGDRRVVDWAVAEAERHSMGVVTVVPKGQATGPGLVEGGTTRSESVRRGLAAVPEEATIIVVHDAARPFASPQVFHRVIGAVVDGADAAVPGIPVTDTIKQVNESEVVVGTPRRETLRAVQTPQAFRYPMLIEAHRRAAAAGRDDFTDDAALVEWAGKSVMTFPGDPQNVKLTTAEDFVRAQAAQGDMRTGMGFDVHAFGDGDHVMLGGIAIAHSRGLTGHSDADVVLHALVDAILGALADGDIGSHFPPSDPQWRGASSDRFLAFAVQRVAARGGRIAHLDVTIVCEAPKIGPHRDAIRRRIAAIADLAPDRVAVKATTSEGLGFTGRGEGIAAFAQATIRLP